MFDGNTFRSSAELSSFNPQSIVRRVEGPVRAGIWNVDRYDKRLEWLVGVLAQEMLPLTAPHDARPHTNGPPELALDPAGHFPHKLKLQCRVERFDRRAAATSLERTLLAVFPHAAAIQISPWMTPPPVVRVRIGVEARDDSRGAPKLAVAELQDRLSIGGIGNDAIRGARTFQSITLSRAAND